MKELQILDMNAYRPGDCQSRPVERRLANLGAASVLFYRQPIEGDLVEAAEERRRTYESVVRDEDCATIFQIGSALDAIDRLGKNVIQERYGNLFEMYERITGDSPYETPMRIYPATHYTMGGLWVDYNLMSTVPGLFVADHHDIGGKPGIPVGVVEVVVGVHQVADGSIGERLERRDQRARVGMQRVSEELADGSGLHHATGIHHHHPVTHLPDNPHVMGDQQNCGFLLPHLFDQRENFGLNGYIQSRRGFVGNDHLRGTY